MATVDVTIFGAGAFGLAVGYACARRKARVRVIDPHGVAAGSSGGVVGALAPHVPENWNDKKEFQFQSLDMAAKFWAEVAEVSGKHAGYARSGRLQPLADDRAIELARMRTESARDLWRGKYQWQVAPAADFGDWCPPTPTGQVVWDNLSALMHPRMACHALASAIVALGGEIVTEGTAEGKILHATGWRGLMELSETVGKNVGNGVKGQAAVLQYNGWLLPQLFADSLHIVPHANGTVAIGSTSEREFNAPDTTDDQLDDVIARAIAAFPVLKNAPVIERWAGVRPRAKSRAPMIGMHPLRDGEFIANGGFKIGFGMAPKIGAVMADLMLDGHDDIPDGFKPTASM